MTDLPDWAMTKARELWEAGLRDGTPDAEIPIAQALHHAYQQGKQDGQREMQERAVKVAARHPGVKFKNARGHIDWRPASRHDIAAAIRSLSPSQPEAKEVRFPPRPVAYPVSAKAVSEDTHKRFPKIMEALRQSEQAWPDGCYSPSSCTRHMACMYTNCRHQGLHIKSEIEAAIKAKEAREDE